MRPVADLRFLSADQRARKRGGGLDVVSLDTQTAASIAEPAVLPNIGAALEDRAELRGRFDKGP